MSELKINILKKEDIKEEIETSTDSLGNKEVPSVIIKSTNKPLISLTKKIEDQKENTIKENISRKKKEETKLLEKNNSELNSINEKKELFENYSSEFTKNEKTILGRIKAIRFIPKTRKGLVASLISLTLIIIVALGIIDPKNHSLNSYKANLLFAYSKIKTIGEKNINNSNNPLISSGLIDNNGTGETIDTTPLTGEIITGTGENINSTNTGSDIENTNTGSMDTTEQTITPVVDNEYEMMKEKWLTIKPNVITLPNGDKVYSYKGNTYSKEGLQEILKVEIKQEIDKKIKEHLSKIYLK